jgi:hypothetical protein
VDPRARRAAENENLFRRINEEVADLVPDGVAEFVCECSDTNCRERIRLSVDRYEDVRAHSDRFVVRSGHERPEFERVIDVGNGYVVVEKTGGAGAVAEADDPRG